MKKQKNIIVPSDFSVTARNAFHYAEKLAESADATLTVAHVNEYFIPISDIAVAPLSRHEEPQLDEAMDNFINEEDISSGTLTKKAIKTRILKGSPMHRIVDLSGEKETDWLVMGTTGLQDFLSKIIGSTSLYVTTQAHFPVFLISRDATWRPIKRILFASNVFSTQPKMMHQIINFAEQFKASIHFVHIDDGHNEVVKVNTGIWDEFLAQKSPTVSFQVHTINDGDAVKALHQYAEEHNIDLVAFIGPHRSFWEHLVHRSVTEGFAMVSERPMLVMHTDDKQ